MQVIGFGEGNIMDNAVENMVYKNPYLKDTKFNKVISIEVKSYKQSVLFLKK